MANIGFFALSLLMIFIDGWIIASALRQHDRDGNFLAAIMGCSAAVCLFYSISICVEDYFVMSLSSSLYFVAMDGVCLSLVAYLFSFTDSWQTKIRFFLMRAFIVVAVVDSAFLLTNPFCEVALTYAYDPEALAPWHYVAMMPFQFHLGFCYVMVCVSFVILVLRMAAVPPVFRRRYILAMVGIVVIVAVNAVFLYVPRSSLLDYSILFYSLMGVFMYLTEFEDNGRIALSATQHLIIEQLGRSVLLFDFEGRFAACNDEGKKFVPEEKRNRHYYISDFLRDQGLDDRVPDTLEDITFAQRFKVDGQWLPYRFDLHNLCDKEGHHLGYLVVLVDHSFQVDLLTSFHTKAVFEQTFKRRDPRTVRYPVTISVCDLNHLADLNIEQGRAAGDDAIKCMADAMQNAFPSDSFFVRHDEANLLVLNEGMEAEEAKKALLLVEEELRHVAFGGVNLEMQSAVSVAQEGDSLIKAADEALLALRMRKMLDFESAHSSLLASLAMTQRQSDGETEEHIRRTRAVADVLSRRLGLSDWDQSSLALLCLLHDIGKVGVPLEILNKPGRLTDAEWVVLKSHTTKGYEIASASSELRGIADGILHHHERWDGAGYPDGLSGETIPLLARILAVIDTYDAMTHDRPYRRRVSKEVALDELRKCAGTQFDPVIVAEFLEMMEQGVESDQALLDDAAYNATDALLEEDPMPQHVAAAVIEARSMGVDEGESAGETEVLGLVPYAKYQLNSEGSIIYVSDNFQELTGYSWQDVQDYSLTQQDLLFPEDTAAYWKIVNEQLSTVGEAYLDHRLRRKDGSEQYVFCFGRVFFDSVLRASISEIVIGDVSAAASVKTAIERSRLSALHGLRRWQEKANQDALTGLLNRSAAREMAQLRLLGGPDETILVMVDVDHFKEFNDSYGHPEGDVLLTALARSLERAVEEDGLPCRMGGDEFAVILSAPKGASKDKIEKRVAHLWQRVNNDLKATFPTVTVSMGAAATGGTPMTVRKLYVEADQALYEAKQAGRNCFRCQW